MGQINGSVMDAATGQPIAGATVQTYDSNGNKTMGSAPTAANGSFVIYTPFDGGTVSVSADGYTTQTLPSNPVMTFQMASTANSPVPPVSPSSSSTTNTTNNLAGLPPATPPTNYTPIIIGSVIFLGIIILVVSKKKKILTYQ